MWRNAQTDKVPKYLVLKGSKKIRGAFGAAKSYLYTQCALDKDPRRRILKHHEYQADTGSRTEPKKQETLSYADTRPGSNLRNRFPREPTKQTSTQESERGCLGRPVQAGNDGVPEQAGQPGTELAPPLVSGQRVRDVALLLPLPPTG